MPFIALKNEVQVAAERARVVALLTIIALSVAGTAWLLEGVREAGDVSSWDGPALNWLVAHRSPFTTSVMTAITWMGGEVALSVIATLTVLVLAVRRHRVEASLLAAALGSAEAISLILKFSVGRARPLAADALGSVEHTLSFPSGHTIGTATFSLALAYLWWRARPTTARACVGLGAAAVLTVLMATSRLYLGDHWLTDVLASIVLSFGVMSGVILLDTSLQRWHRSRAVATRSSPTTTLAGVSADEPDGTVRQRQVPLSDDLLR